MSGNHDHDHDTHSNEQKPVSFTVPLILASVLLVIIFLLVSTCDPKKHGEEHGHQGHDEHATEATMGHEEQNADAKEDHVESKDSMAVETAAPSAEDPTHAAATATASEANH